MDCLREVTGRDLRHREAEFDPDMKKSLRTAPAAETVGGVDLMFRAFSDRTRLRILHVLLGGECCVGDIVQILRAPQPRISRHLAYLRKARLVVARKSGQWSHYSLSPAETPFHREILECLSKCFGEVPEIKADAARAAKIRQSGGCCPRDAGVGAAACGRGGRVI